MLENLKLELEKAKNNFERLAMGFINASEKLGEGIESQELYSYYEDIDDLFYQVEKSQMRVAETEEIYRKKKIMFKKDL